MSIGSKRKDKDAKAASGGEASGNYNIEPVQGGGGVKSTTTTGKQEPTSPNSSRPSTAQDVSTTQRITSSSTPPSEDQISTEAIATTDASSSSSATFTSKETPYQYQYQHNYQQQSWGEQQSGINRALDGTKDSIRKSTDEARRDIPRYTQAVNDYHEHAIESAREIADNFLESQKQIIDSFQSAWLPQIDAANRVLTSTWTSPRYFTHAYANMVSNFADNWVTAVRLANNAIFSNMEALRTTIQQARENTKEISRINVNTARSLEQTSRDVTNNYGSSSGFYSSGGGGRYTFKERQQQQQQIPSIQNQEDTQNVMEVQNHIAGQRRQQSVTDLPTAAAVGQALKDMRFPADKRRIQLFVQQQQAGNNLDYHKIVSLLDKLEDRQYHNVSDVTKAAGIVEL